MVHPRYLFGALEPSYYADYKERHRVRALQSYKAMSEMMIKPSLVKIKEHPPYIGDMEGKVLLNSLARATLDPKTGQYSFKGKLNTEFSLDLANVKAISEIAAGGGLATIASIGVGVDQGLSPIYCFQMRYSISCRAHLRCSLA